MHVLEEVGELHSYEIRHQPTIVRSNKYVRPRNTRTEMEAGRVACCPLVRHFEYASRALLTLEKRWDRLTDGHQTNALCFVLDAGQCHITGQTATVVSHGQRSTCL